MLLYLLFDAHKQKCLTKIMTMKKIFTLIIIALGLNFSLHAEDLTKDWNISNSSFNALGEMTSNTTVDGLTIMAASGSSVTVDANNKSEGGISYTHRLKLGGTGVFTDGQPTSRVLTFPVSGNVQITIKAMSSSSSATDRILAVKTAAGQEIGNYNVPASALNSVTYSYTGGATTIQMASVSSGINIYHIVVTGPGVIANLKGVNSDLKPIKTVFYSISGKIAGDNFNALKKGAYIQKTTYDNGTVKMTKLLKANN